MRTVMLVVGLGVLVIVGATLWIDEGEVISLETTDPSGQVFETDLWVAEHEGALYVRGERAARWVQRVRKHPEVTVVRGGVARVHHATPSRDPETLAGVNAAMASKYGVADRLFGHLFADGNRIVIRLDPESQASTGPDGGEVSSSGP